MSVTAKPAWVTSRINCDNGAHDAEGFVQIFGDHDKGPVDCAQPGHQIKRAIGLQADERSAWLPECDGYP